MKRESTSTRSVESVAFVLALMIANTLFNTFVSPNLLFAVCRSRHEVLLWSVINIGSVLNYLKESLASVN